MTTTKQILRWLAVLPGAVLAGMIVLFPVHWVGMYIHHFGAGEPIITTDDDRGLLQSMPLESIERFGDALFVPGTIIAVGARIAPRFRFATAIVLTVLFAGLMCFLFVQVTSMGMHIEDSTFRMVITILLWLVSVAFGLFHAREIDQQA
jgi:hypothetical protein